MAGPDINSICMMYRRAHTDKHIIHIICTVHSLTANQVRGILIENHMMSPDGGYIAPIRLTGKEKTMPQWKWSPQRKKLYEQLVAEGKMAEEIAQALACSVEVVRKYSADLQRKPSSVVTRKVEQAPAAPTVPKQVPLLHTLVLESQELCRKTWEAEEDDAAYNLGQLQARLDLAVKLLNANA